jgi:hypothetical protein
VTWACTHDMHTSGDAQGAAARAQDHLSGLSLSLSLSLSLCVCVCVCAYTHAHTYTHTHTHTHTHTYIHTHTHILTHTHTQITTEHHVLTKLQQQHNPKLLTQQVLAYGCHKSESYILVTGILYVCRKCALYVCTSCVWALSMGATRAKADGKADGTCLSRVSCQNLGTGLYAVSYHFRIIFAIALYHFH